MQQRDLVRDFYLLRGAAHEDLAAVDAVAERSRQLAGTTVFHEGDRADAMYLVAHGTVDVLKSDNETTIATLGTGDEFGEVAFFEDGRRSATVRTRERQSTSDATAASLPVRCTSCSAARTSSIAVASVNSRPAFA